MACELLTAVIGKQNGLTNSLFHIEMFDVASHLQLQSFKLYSGSTFENKYAHQHTSIYAATLSQSHAGDLGYI